MRRRTGSKKRKSAHEKVTERIDRKIDPKVLAYVEHPGPDERAVLLLAQLIEKSKNPDYVVVSWASQKEAADVYNENGLIATLNILNEHGMLED